MKDLKNASVRSCSLAGVRLAEFIYSPEWFLESDGPTYITFELSDGRILLAEAKRRSLTDSSPRPCIPKAVGQAIAWATVTGFVMSLRESSLKLVKAKGSFVFAVKRTVMGIFYPEIRR